MYKTMGDVRADVESHGGVLTMKMGALRDAHGVRKLGVHVRTGISEALKGAGLAHLPDPLPGYQEDLVRVYKQGTQVARLIGAATAPSIELDDILRQAVGGEASDILAKIRELVCE